MGAIGFTVEPIAHGALLRGRWRYCGGQFAKLTQHHGCVCPRWQLERGFQDVVLQPAVGHCIRPQTQCASFLFETGGFETGAQLQRLFVGYGNELDIARCILGA